MSGSSLGVGVHICKTSPITTVIQWLRWKNGQHLLQQVTWWLERKLLHSTWMNIRARDWAHESSTASWRFRLFLLLTQATTLRTIHPHYTVGYHRTRPQMWRKKAAQNGKPTEKKKTLTMCVDSASHLQVLYWTIFRPHVRSQVTVTSNT